ncbi:hypothetical protein [Parachlamydia sp.]|uniref:hypothetical protein n=1 Tax=Parachlamydia sp. TaxID=2052048 RepID=UPI003D0D8228
MLPTTLATQLWYYAKSEHEEAHPATNAIIERIQLECYPPVSYMGRRHPNQDLVDVCKYAIIFFESTKTSYSLKNRLQRKIKHCVKLENLQFHIALKFMLEWYSATPFTKLSTKKIVTRLLQDIQMIGSDENKVEDLKKICADLSAREKTPPTLKAVLTNTLLACQSTQKQRERLNSLRISMLSPITVYIWKAKGNIGHIALKTSRQYISFLSKHRVRSDNPSNCHLYFNDLKDLNRTADQKITLYSLNTDLILQGFNILKQLNWKEATEKNCSSAIAALLILGGFRNIFDNVFSPLPDASEIQKILEAAQKKMIDIKIKYIFTGKVLPNHFSDPLKRASEIEQDQYENLIDPISLAKNAINNVIYENLKIDVKLHLYVLKRDLVLDTYRLPVNDAHRIKRHALVEMVKELHEVFLQTCLKDKTLILERIDQHTTFFKLLAQHENFNHMGYWEYLNAIIESYKFDKNTKHLKNKWIKRIEELKKLSIKEYHLGN